MTDDQFISRIFTQKPADLSGNSVKLVCSTKYGWFLSVIREPPSFKNVIESAIRTLPL